MLLSPAVEDYLKAIYKLQDGGVVAQRDLAAALDVSAASVTNMAKRLDRLGLVRHASYRGVTLTEAGERIALEIIRHHRLLETYLREVMGYDWEAMHAEAEQLEHHISEDFEARIDALLGHPTHDPHGDPIPTPDGRMPDVAQDPLARCLPGERVVVRRVADEEPAALTHLEELGLLPGSVLRVTAADASGIHVTVGEASHLVPPKLARRVFVSEASLDDPEDDDGQ
jgi:DtxR family Mn-dependent transcriptional regulator